MRVFTCTPVAFGGGADFFARDSGLMCRGFQAIGWQARAVMPGVRRPEDLADLIRTEYENLESADWWRSHGLDAVILYAWGRPKFRKIARAVRDAGIFLVLNQDNGGLISPLAGFRGWLHEQWILTGSGGDWRQIGAFFKLVLKGATLGLCVTDPLRASHLKHGNVIACVSPRAADHYHKLCRIYGGSALAHRVHVIPHPVESIFRFTGVVRKLRQVACVGRWDDEIQKRPAMLQDVAERVLMADCEVVFVIAGQTAVSLAHWRDSLPPGLRERVRLVGRVSREQLVEILGESSIFYSPSAFESFGIAAGEALCSGCSVVAGRSPSMSAFEWFTSDASGSLCAKDDVRGHVDALTRELREWDEGRRDPVGIAEMWGSRLHADQVAGRVAALISRQAELGSRSRRLD